ncbi:MAG: tRNA lysidine(34) synthetase TilS [Sphingomonadaceae bacterium]|nr:tRNA lysidine(34) synthetase TilS [Sphingomonadaceae bacterium]
MQSEDFRNECNRLTGAPITAGKQLGLAVSGGPDSLAMLLLAHGAFPGAIAAATVDHGLRPEAAGEAEYVASLCADLDVPHAILTPAAPIEGNLQSEARKARYALLENWRAGNDLAWVATAHHADDQLETQLMRLMRGSGIDGLSAIRPVNDHVIRPLLNVRKAELETYLAKRGIEAAHDAGNEDTQFDRVRIRQMLADLPGYDPSRIAQSAAALREASEALKWVVRREAGKVVEDRGDAVSLLEIAYPPELLRRLVQLCLEEIEPGIAPRGEALDRFIDTLRSGRKARIGAILGETQDEDGSSSWRFTLAPPRKTG